MPFFGQDWRSSGSIWVRTSSGWQTGQMSVVAEFSRQFKKFRRERIAVNAKPESSQNPSGYGTSYKGTYKNFLFVPSEWRSSRLTGKFLTPGDILCNFDFGSALRDCRRFRYICRVLDVIIEDHFTSLSGSAFNALFRVCEEAVDFAKRDQLFINRIQEILTRTREQMVLNHQGMVGSRAIYNCRLHVLDCWVKELSSIELFKQREDDRKPTLMDLPAECQRLIFRCLSDPVDVLHLSQTCRQLNIIGNDDILWGKLFWYHFTEAQLPVVPLDDECNRDWKTGIMRLCKHHPLKEEFVTMMAWCSHCCCVYWEGSKHPCSSETPKEGENHQMVQLKDVQTQILSPVELISIVKAP